MFRSMHRVAAGLATSTRLELYLRTAQARELQALLNHLHLLPSSSTYQSVFTSLLQDFAQRHPGLFKQYCQGNITSADVLGRFPALFSTDMDYLQAQLSLDQAGRPNGSNPLGVHGIRNAVQPLQHGLANVTLRQEVGAVTRKHCLTDDSKQPLTMYVYGPQLAANAAALAEIAKDISGRSVELSQFDPLAPREGVAPGNLTDSEVELVCVEPRNYQQAHEVAPPHQQALHELLERTKSSDGGILLVSTGHASQYHGPKIPRTLTDLRGVIMRMQAMLNDALAHPEAFREDVSDSGARMRDFSAELAEVMVAPQKPTSEHSVGTSNGVTVYSSAAPVIPTLPNGQHNQMAANMERIAAAYGEFPRPVI